VAPKRADPEEPIEKPKIVMKIRQVAKKAAVVPEPKMVTPVEEDGIVSIPTDAVAMSAPLTETIPGSGEQSASRTGSREGGGVGGYGIGGGSADALRKKYLSEHFAYIKEIIQKNIVYPHIARRMGWQGKVIVDFIILENGKASQITIAQSSGFAVLDNNVVKTVKKINPFPKPPVEAKLKVPITYRLKEF
jgi:protein TonB